MTQKAHFWKNMTHSLKKFGSPAAKTPSSISVLSYKQLEAITIMTTYTEPVVINIFPSPCQVALITL